MFRRVVALLSLAGQLLAGPDFQGFLLVLWQQGQVRLHWPLVALVHLSGTGQVARVCRKATSRAARPGWMVSVIPAVLTVTSMVAACVIQCGRSGSQVSLR